MTLLFVNFGNQHTKKRTALSEEDMASCSRAFRKPKNVEEEWKLIENGTPKSANTEKKYSLKTLFWNGRKVQ